MDIFLYNTLTKNKELFTPLKKGHVSMYHCGPTVYNFVHIGNLRAFITADIMRRVFEFNHFTTTQVMNITDIGHLQSDADDGEDKMTLALKRQGKPLTLSAMREVAGQFYDAFRQDIERVSILPAHFYPFASDHIEADIDYIQKLLSKGHAYIAGDGVYFDTESIETYGRLGGISSLEDVDKNETRLSDEHLKKSEKKNPRDFAVWKFNSELGYEAPFGKGFPGWHIECSVMSQKYLGDTFDVHTGGIDHIPVHHNNEIAQSEAYSGQLLANYWLHNAHIIMEGGKKMAKSGEQFITLDWLQSEGVSPLAFRFWTLGASYRTPIQYSLDALKQAEHAYRLLISKIAGILDTVPDTVIEDDDQQEEHLKYWHDEFNRAVNDDFDTARGVAILQTMLKNGELRVATKVALIKAFDSVLGLELISSAQTLQSENEAMHIDIPGYVHVLAKERIEARKVKDWKRADELRDEISAHGYEVIDTDTGYSLRKA